MKRRMYQQLTWRQKRKVREVVAEIRRGRKEQIAAIDDGFLRPLRESVAACDKVIKNTMSLEEFLDRQDATDKHIKNCFKR